MASEPFPAWMTAVQAAVMDISNRLYAAGMGYPPIPHLSQATYLLYCDVDPKVVAVLLVRDEMMKIKPPTFGPGSGG